MRFVATALDTLPKELAKLRGTTIAGSYRIDGVLGSGNKGVVFKGLQLEVQCQAAPARPILQQPRP